MVVAAPIKKIGEMLIEKGLITQEQLDQALKKQNLKQSYVGEVFVQEGWVSSENLMETLAEQYKVAFLRFKDMDIAKEAIDQVPLKIALRYHIIPTNLNKKKLTIAMLNPQDVRVLDELRLALHQRFSIDTAIATKDDIRKAIEKYYGLGAETVDRILGKKEQTIKSNITDIPEIEDIDANDQEASVVKLVNEIMLEAHSMNASDIHFEPYRGKTRLRYRVDGVLKTIETPPTMVQLFPAIISRLKILSNLNIVEHRIPQDGRASIKVGDKQLDLRTSIIPTPMGESIVIRILPSQMLFDLKQLGFDGQALSDINELVQKKHGLIFVTGPTGSGKSTTLYSCLRLLNNEDSKIITIEDPVEYEMEGITQVQINSKVGLTFASGLRSMLRHDPDIMMVGEVRDLETAELAIRIALTGHLVFSTLHTNDAATGVSRLIDMGIDPFLITSSVRTFIAQRLVRLICQNCKEEVKSEWPEAKKAYRGKGCESCLGSGFSGRSVIYEILPLSSQIKELVMKKVSSDEIKKQAIKEGMRTLAQEGWDKVNKGLTTAEEVFRVTTSDE